MYNKNRYNKTCHRNGMHGRMMWQWLVVWVTVGGALSVETGYGEVADLFVALAPRPLPRHHRFCCRR